MVIFAIILSAIGMLLLPFGRLYIVWQQNKNTKKFSDERYVKRFRNCLRILSLVFCGVALLLIYFLQHT